jgi:hypothetical protein
MQKIGLAPEFAVCKYLRMARPALKCRPRPWLTRREGECAFPVDGEGHAVRSCCAPCPGAVYCPLHRAAMRGGPALPVVVLERRLRELGL